MKMMGGNPGGRDQRAEASANKTNRFTLFLNQHEEGNEFSPWVSMSKWI